jgi:hypothetical protein
MLSDDDLKALEKMMTAVLESYGLKKPPSAAALRMQRYRERQRNAASRNVTGSHAKRNGYVTNRNESTDPIVIEIPLNDGSEFPVTEPMVKEFEGLYPQVDVAQTLREIRGWCITNQAKRKTRTGVMRFVNGWLAREQNKG